MGEESYEGMIVTVSKVQGALKSLGWKSLRLPVYVMKVYCSKSLAWCF